MRRSAAVLPLVLLMFGTAAAGDLTADDVLRMIMESQTRQEQLQNRYVWHEHVEFGRSRPDGSERRKTDTIREFEVSWESGSHYRELISENGRPLTPAQAEKKKVLVRRPITTLASFLPGRTNRLVRSETIAGRDCWVIESDPSTDQPPYRRTFWVDKEDKVVTRIHQERLGKTEKGTLIQGTIFFQKSSDGVWLESRSENVIAAMDLHRMFSQLQTIDFSAYQRFTTDTAIQFHDPN